MSLRNFSDKHSATVLLHITGFFIFPMLPFAQLLRQLRSAVILSFDRRRRGLTLYISACCGMHIAKSRQAIDAESIIKADPDQIRRKRASYNAL